MAGHALFCTLRQSHCSISLRRHMVARGTHPTTKMHQKGMKTSHAYNVISYKELAMLPSWLTCRLA